MQLDDHLKNLLRELGHAINDTVSESDRITGAIAGVRAHGYDIVLKLDATIGLAKRDGQADDGPRITTQDRRFLESLRIQVDQESMEQDAEKKPVARLTMTPQDVCFLKSLRIATLLDKPERRQRPVQVTYVGFQIPDEFVVGYGLDYAEDYRNLRDICVLEDGVA